MGEKRIDVKHIANLAGLDLTDEELQRFQKDLQEILNYFSQIDEVDVSNLSLTYHEHLGYQRLRDDIPSAESGLSRDEALANAPDKEDSYFKIPPILR